MFPRILLSGGTMPKTCSPNEAACVPGCVGKSTNARWCDSSSVRLYNDQNADIYQCAFRPDDLDAMLQRHLNNNPWVYNEIVVDAHAWVPSLPNGVVAFFYEAGAGQDYNTKKRAEDKGHEVHQNFARRYPRHRTGHSAPLVKLDLGARNGQPAFTLVSE